MLKIYILLGKCKLFYDRKFKKIINKSIKNEFYIVLWILKFYNIFWRIFQYRLLKFGNWQRWEKDVETEKNKFKTRSVKNNRHILALKCRYTTVTVQSCELICLARVLATLDPIGIFVISNDNKLATNEADLCRCSTASYC